MEKKNSPYFYVMTMSVVYQGKNITGTYHGTVDTYEGSTTYEAYGNIRIEVFGMLARDINNRFNPVPRLEASDIESLPPVVLYYCLERNAPLQVS